MCVASLTGAGRDVEQVEARVAEHDGRDEERIGAAVDVAQPAQFFDRAAQHEEPAVAEARGDDAAAAFDAGCAGEREIHPGYSGVGLGGEVDGGVSLDEGEVGGVGGQVEFAVPALEL